MAYVIVYTIDDTRYLMLRPQTDKYAARFAVVEQTNIPHQYKSLQRCVKAAWQVYDAEKEASYRPNLRIHEWRHHKIGDAVWWSH